jgi:hypothetical protein
MATLKSDVNSPLSGDGLGRGLASGADKHGYVTVKMGYGRIIVLAVVVLLAVVGVVKVLMG